MPKGHPRTACKGCDRPVAATGTLSAVGLCEECGRTRRTDNLVGLVTHSGPYFDHWRRQCLAAFGVVTVDETVRGR